MLELERIFDAWHQALAKRQRCVLATVIRVAGSAYRRPGARMLFVEGREPIGLVSGGCLEADLAERAQQVLASGEPTTVLYDMRSPDDVVWGLGLGCNGEIHVLLELLDGANPPAYFGQLQHQLQQRRPSVLATTIESQPGLPLRMGTRAVLSADAEFVGPTSPIPDEGWAQRIQNDARRVLQSGKSANCCYESDAGPVEVLVELIPRQIRLIVFGAGIDAQPVVQLARDLGWQVQVFDNRPAYADAQRFPQAADVRCIDYDHAGAEIEPVDPATAVVLMTHHFLHDLKILAGLLPLDLPYIGLLGPRQRTENLLQQLQDQGGAEDLQARCQHLYGPVGLDLGSDSPEAIALAITAEIQAVLHGRSAGFLRDRTGPLHDWP